MTKTFQVAILNPDTGRRVLQTICRGRIELINQVSEAFFFHLDPRWHVPISHFKRDTLPDQYRHYIYFNEFHRGNTVTFTLPPVAWNVIDTMVPPHLPPLPEPPLPLFAWNIKDKLMPPHLPPLPEPPLGLDNDFF